MQEKPRSTTKKGLKMKLRDYILKHYNGRNIDFAEANEMSAQAVGVMIKKGIYYIYDGMLMIARKEVK
jgi:hypothetical protein